MWTISGLYFSWTNIDDIHGDQFRKTGLVATSFSNLLSPSSLSPSLAITSIDLREINNEPYYWINKNSFIMQEQFKNRVSKAEALLQ
jgi:hypothetical protein